MKYKKFFFIGLVTLLIACYKEIEPLPIYGIEVVNNESSTDTIFKTIPDFKFTNQDNVIVTQKQFQDKIYVADFFFTTCPTICPMMKSQMLRIYEEFYDNQNILLLSHSIDPKHDTVEVLKKYSDKIGINSGKWHLVTGNKDDIFTLAQEHYMVSAKEDPSAPGGAVHSGAFILVDKQKRIRGYYDGTDKKEVDQLLIDINKLLKE